MTTIPPLRDAGPTDSSEQDVLEDTLEEQFLALVCSDEDLLQAEFEAIIAAEWPTPPAAHPPLHRPARRPPGRPAGQWREVTLERLASRPRHPGIGGWARQRSPPNRTGTPAQPEPNDQRRRRDDRRRPDDPADPTWTSCPTRR